MSINVSSLQKSISGAAEDISGNVSNFREILSTSPQLSPFEYPPAVQSGIDALETVGVTLPSEDELVAIANDQISAVFDELAPELNSALDVVEDALGFITGASDDAATMLNKITWLL